MWKCEACSPKYTEGCNAKFLRVVYQRFFFVALGYFVRGNHHIYRSHR